MPLGINTAGISHHSGLVQFGHFLGSSSRLSRPVPCEGVLLSRPALRLSPAKTNQVMTGSSA